MQTGEGSHKGGAPAGRTEWSVKGLAHDKAILPEKGATYLSLSSLCSGTIVVALLAYLFTKYHSSVIVGWGKLLWKVHNYNLYI